MWRAPIEKAPFSKAKMTFFSTFAPTSPWPAVAGAVCFEAEGLAFFFDVGPSLPLAPGVNAAPLAAFFFLSLAAERLGGSASLDMPLVAPKPAGAAATVVLPAMGPMRRRHKAESALALSVSLMSK